MELLPKAGAQRHGDKDILYDGQGNSIWAWDMWATRFLCLNDPFIFKYMFLPLSFPLLPLFLSPSLAYLRLTESNLAAEYNLEPLISLPPLSVSCDYIHVPPYLVYAGLRLEPRTHVFGVCGIWV